MPKYLSILIAALSVALPAFAQQGRGSISGTVTDASGASVPGATVLITNSGTAAVFNTVSNDDGYFTAPALQVGSYSVAVEKAGFKRINRTGITLQVDQHVALNLKLEIGATTESINVVAEAPLVDTGSATVGKVVENRASRSCRLTDATPSASSCSRRASARRPALPTTTSSIAASPSLPSASTADPAL